jgi:hypothetical protein
MTLLEVSVSFALVSLIGLYAASALDPLGKTQRRAVVSQTLTSAADQILNAIDRELSAASPESIIFDPALPGILTYGKPEKQPDGTFAISKHFSLRVTTVPNSEIAGLELAQEDVGALEDFIAGLSGAAATMCHRELVPKGKSGKFKVKYSDVLVDPTTAVTHSEHGDRFGPCPDPPMILGSHLALADPVDPTLPGLHFNVRVKGDATLVDVALTLEQVLRGELVQLRLVTTFRVGGG